MKLASATVRLALLTTLLALALLFAAKAPPRQFHPLLSFEVSDQRDTLTLSFIFQMQNSQTACEALMGKVVRETLKQCPQCRVSESNCATHLNEAQRTLLSPAPLTEYAARISGGALLFQASNPRHAHDACILADTATRPASPPMRCDLPGALRPPLTTRIIDVLWSPVLFLAGLAATWLASWLIIRYEHLHARFSHDHTHHGPQKYHKVPTPRIGGLALMTGLLFGHGLMLVSEVLKFEQLFGVLLLAALPAFGGGFVEDVTRKVGVAERLILTMIAAVLAAWLLGSPLKRLDVPGLDTVLAWLPLAIAVTAFAVSGVTNAINIIDGTHGLAAGTALIALGGFATLSWQLGDGFIFDTSLILAGCLFGFMAWNWPRGKIFLGDGGAYLMGFLLAEIAVLIVVRNPAVSPWFPLVVLAYPVVETLYSIYRRKLLHQTATGQPDNHHLHQLIHDHLVAPHGNNRRWSLNRNSRVAPYLWFQAAMLSVLGVLFWDSTDSLVILFLLYALFYVINHRWLSSYRRRAIS
ncbi:MAG: hypothetical protein FJ189_01940 [Gammaproteobacteria bacterium]|nr:hypothetical protein [Gammaproteobacteria bacterium]